MNRRRCGALLSLAVSLLLLNGCDSGSEKGVGIDRERERERVRALSQEAIAAVGRDSLEDALAAIGTAYSRPGSTGTLAPIVGDAWEAVVAKYSPESIALGCEALYCADHKAGLRAAGASVFYGRREPTYCAAHNRIVLDLLIARSRREDREVYPFVFRAQQALACANGQPVADKLRAVLEFPAFSEELLAKLGDPPLNCEADASRPQ